MKIPDEDSHALLPEGLKPARGMPGDPPDAALQAAYAILAFNMNRWVLDQLLRGLRRFGGDSDQLILFGVIAHLNVAHLMPPGSVPSSVLDAAGALHDVEQRMRPIRLRDLAQITGISRETARRKLDLLQAAGWIVRTQDGWVIDVEQTRSGLRDFTLESVRRFMQTARVMQDAVDDAARAIDPGCETAMR